MFKNLPRYLLICFSSLLFLQAEAQDYNYVHYDTKDGLAGAAVYDICQDKQGFIWFGTETGLSRFDGSHFVNFTTKEGLPDNEALELMCDYQGRVWIGTFNKQVCYYLNGKIHNNSNDTLLRKVALKNLLREKIVLNDSTVVLSDGRALAMIYPDNRVEMILCDSICKTPGSSLILFRSNDFNYEMILENSVTHLHYSFDRVSKKFFLLKEDPPFVFQPSIVTAKVSFEGGKVHRTLVKVDVDNSTLSYQSNGASLEWFNTTNGSFQFNLAKQSFERHYLIGKRVSAVLVDKEQNTWFTTLGEGVYKLPSPETRTFRLSAPEKIAEEVFSIARQGEKLVIGSYRGKGYYLENKKPTTDFVVDQAWRTPSYLSEKGVSDINRLFCMAVLNQNTLVLGFDKYIVKKENERLTYNEIFGIKEIAQINQNQLLIAAARGAYLINAINLQVTDTIFPTRSTAVGYDGKTMYVGTINGLYAIDKNRVVTNLGTKEDCIARRITHIKNQGNMLWVATGDAGVVGLRNNQVVVRYTEKEGLASDICRTLFVQDDYLWVGTNKGISRISLRKNSQEKAITNYTVLDGLASNIINAIEVKDSLVYVGSPEGLTYFNPRNISGKSSCDLVITSVDAGGIQYNDVKEPITVAYNNRNIRISFVGISFKSAGDISYRYLLKGVNEGWQQTSLNSIVYPSLPAGDYTLTLVAINKFGIESLPVVVKFTIATPWWQTWWFIGFVSVGSVALLWWLISVRFKAIAQRKEQEQALKEQVAYLEQQALQAQMNPHFIFNCLNSIQNFIINKDLVATNKYLNHFSYLLRKTLDEADKQSITILNEVDYLSKYIELEKMRFGDAFNYEITVADNIPADFTYIPSMMLQPFVENSIRHGMRYKKDGAGLIKVSFTQTEQQVICTVTDNGIGRKQAAIYKSSQHIEYQSKGVELTLNRLRLLSDKWHSNIETQIIDLEDAQGVGIGTQVIIGIPLVVINGISQ